MARNAQLGCRLASWLRYRPGSGYSGAGGLGLRATRVLAGLGFGLGLWRAGASGSGLRALEYGC